jgi:GTPase SAR1 family protein
MDRNNNNREVIEKLSFIFDIIDISGQDSISALISNIEDYEDGLIVFSALRNDINAIITRNERDILDSDIIIINPKDIDRYVDAEVEAGSVVIDNVF